MTLPDKKSFNDVFEQIFFGPYENDDYYLAFKSKGKSTIAKLKLQLDE